MIGSTPFANEYEFEFAKELMVYENVGQRSGHRLAFGSACRRTTSSATRSAPILQRCSRWRSISIEIADFINFLGHQIGLANVWIALSANGVSSLPDTSEETTHSGGRISS